MKNIDIKNYRDIQMFFSSFFPLRPLQQQMIGYKFESSLRHNVHILYILEIS